MLTGSAAILAGGASRRFGSTKALYPINGRPMIAVVAEKLAQCFSSVFVAGWPQELPAPIPLNCHVDLYKGKGALGGIHTALQSTQGDWVFCCGCDMPLVQPLVVQRIIASIGEEDILVPVVGGVRQSLHAVYKQRLLPVANRLCLSSDMYLPDLIQAADVRCLDEASLADIPDYALSFVSLNDRHQLTQYTRHLSTL